MIRYLGRRLSHGIVLLVLISVLSFALFQLAPGSFTDAVRLDPRVSAETAAMLRARYGLDRPLPFRYVVWLGSVLRGEFGFSLSYSMPVGRLIWPRMMNTLLLAGSAALIAWPAAILMGMAAALSRHVVRNLILLSMAILVSLPELLIALGLLLLAVHSGYVPGGAIVSSPGRFRHLIEQAALPAAALVLAALPTLVRHTEAALREALQAPFVLAALAHGVPCRRVLVAYALPVAANPLISIFGLSIGAFLSASLVIEIVMGWPGLGPLVLDSVLSRDSPVVIAATLISAAMFVFGNLVADVLLYATDPRLRRAA
jgi:peptide/nickel transport system permease protein